MNRGQTVHVIDDDPTARAMLVWALEGAGFVVREWPGADAFVAEITPADRGCVLVDLVMPVLTGIDLVERHHLARFTMPVTVLTAYGDVPTTVRAVRAGAVTVLEKPVPPKALVTHVRQLLVDDASGWRERREVAELTASLDRLSPREREVMASLLRGDTAKTSADRLGISDRTIEVHRQRILKKTRSDSAADLLRRMVAFGLYDAWAAAPEPP